MMKARSALVAVSVALATAFVLPGHAQAANPKYQACLKEAEGKGLLVTNTGGKAMGGRANASLSGQRKAFMQECMARK
jgi:hypothetical protein